MTRDAVARAICCPKGQCAMEPCVAYQLQTATTAALDAIEVTEEVVEIAGQEIEQLERLRWGYEARPSSDYRILARAALTAALAVWRR